MKVRASYHQERLYFIDQFETGHIYNENPTYYNCPVIIEINGPLKIDLLQSSIQYLLSNHEIFRTNLVQVDGILYQKTSNTISFNLTQAAASNKTEAFDIAQDYTKQPFLLESDKLVRGQIINFAGEHNLLALVFHHVCVDRESIKIFLNQLSELYASQILRIKRMLKKTSLQYADIAEWQRNSLEESNVSQIQFWKNNIGQKNMDLNFPSQKVRRSIHIYEAHERSFNISESIHKQALRFCKKNSIEPETFYMSIFKILLSKFCNQNEISIGSVCSFRKTVKESENVVGPLENLYPIISEITGESNFNQLVWKLDLSLKQLKLNAMVPFDRLVSGLSLEQDMSRTPLFDVLFRYDPHTPFQATIDATTFIQHETNLGWGKYDLNLLLFNNKQENITGILTYNSLYFSPDIIDSFIHHFSTLINKVLLNPTVAIANLSLIDSANSRLGAARNMPAKLWKKDTVSSVFSKQSSCHPDKVCLAFKDRNFTYGHVEKLSNQLAAILVNDYQVKPGTCVGILLERSEWLVISVLGVLKTGAIYIPLDLHHPKTRILDIIKQCGLGMMITSPAQHTKFDFDKSIQSMVVPFEFNSNGKFSPLLQMSADPIYILFTSGTTGTPKGCVISHANILNLILNEEMPVTYGKSDIWIMIHSFAFDFSVWEIFGAILTGGKLIIPSQEIIHDVYLLLDTIRKSNITILNQTPLLFNLVIDIESFSDDKSLDSHLRYIIFGGDRLTSQPIVKWRKLYPENKVKLVNMYGITETTIHSTAEIIDIDRISLTSAMSIGRPLPGEEIYILDRDLNLVPENVGGEIFIGGNGVCYGYCNLQELTTEKFIQTAAVPDILLYKSGDLGKWLEDGSIAYLGRGDRQVKVRGHRIELGEIESAMCRYAGITKAIARVIGEGQKLSVVAYYVAKAELESSKLRSFLQEQLPNYMVPNITLPIKNVPLSLNGKIDWKQLPAPSVVDEKKTSVKFEPRNELEKKLLAIWQNVIGVQNIGIRDNFFEIGGDSIQALKISALMHSQQYKLEINDFFQNPTIELLTPLIKKIEMISDQKIVSGNISLLPIQEFYFKRKDLYSTDFIQSCTLFPKEKVSVTAFEKAIYHLHEHHDGLRVTFSKGENEVLQTNHNQNYPVSVVSFDFASENNPSEKIKIEVKQLQKSIDISKGPLMKTAIFHLDQYDQIVLIMHHLVSDWISWNIILEDLKTLYDQITNGTEVKLPNKTTSLKQWAEGINAMANSNYEILQDLNYWYKVASTDLRPLFEQESELSRSFKDTKTVSFEIEDTVTAPLLTSANNPFKTDTSDLLITALGLTLNRTFKVDKFLLSIESHGRESIIPTVNVSRTVGWFTFNLSSDAGS